MQDVPGSDSTALQGVYGVRPGQTRGSFHTAYVEPFANLLGVPEETSAQEVSRLLQV